MDLVIVPLVAFDHNGNRIGMGGGYYDREFNYLKKEDSPSKPVLIGFAFDCQRFKKIEQDSWDVPNLVPHGMPSRDGCLAADMAVGNMRCEAKNIGHHVCS